MRACIAKAERNLIVQSLHCAAAQTVLLECLAHDWQATQFNIHILCENCSHGLCYSQVPFGPKDIPHGAFASGDS
jgi:hypothetical protein